MKVNMGAGPSSIGGVSGGRSQLHPHLDLPPRGRRRGGFTVLETLLVIALIGLIAAVVAGGIVRMANTDHPTPDDTFWQACHGAQRLASLGEREVTLSFDSKDRKFVWTDGRQTEQAVFDPAVGDITVQFMQARQGGSVILIAGQVVETDEVPRVTFYPDGTCTAFRVQFRTGPNAWQVDIDPWTCAQVLAKKPS